MALKYYVWGVLLFCSFFTVQSASLPWVPRPHDCDAERELLPTDEGWEDDFDHDCFKQLLEGASRRVRSCTSADVACCVLSSFVVAIGGLTVWAVFNETHHHHVHKNE